MSNFLQRFQQSLRGESFESAIVEEPNPTPPEDTSVLSTAEIVDIREDREINEADIDLINDHEAQSEEMQSVLRVTDSVSNAVDIAKTATPSEVNAAVQMANVTIANAELALNTEIPKLDTDETGLIDQVSVEGFGDWIKNAAKAFASATHAGFVRLTTNLTRLSDSSRGLIKRNSTLLAKLQKRKGEGGASISVPSHYRAHLIKGTHYSNNLAGDLSETAKVLDRHSKILMDLGKRIEDYIRNKLVEAITGKSSPSIRDIDVEDLVKEVRELEKSHQEVLGNFIFTAGKSKHPVLATVIKDGVPAAPDVARHADPIKSLSDDEIKTLSKEVVAIASSTLSSFEQADKSMWAAVKSLREAVSRLTGKNTADENGDTEFDEDALMRLENELVSALSDTYYRMADTKGRLNTILNAMTVLMEESIIQD